MYGNSCQDRKVYGRLFKVPERSKERIELLEKRSARHYQFHWPDGWWIGVKIEKLENEKHYRSLKKNLLGDLGYGWMIDNILEHDSCKDLDEEYLREVLEGKHTDI